MKQATVKALTSASVSSAHVDWLTVTASSAESSAYLWSLGDRLLNRPECENEMPARWHHHGYSGWGTNHVQLGARADGTYLRLSSVEAAENWQHALSAAENCSRLDFAVDTQFTAPVVSLVRE